MALRIEIHILCDSKENTFSAAFCLRFVGEDRTVVCLISAKKHSIHSETAFHSHDTTIGRCNGRWLYHAIRNKLDISTDKMFY